MSGALGSAHAPNGPHGVLRKMRAEERTRLVPVVMLSPSNRPADVRGAYEERGQRLPLKGVGEGTVARAGPEVSSQDARHTATLGGVAALGAPGTQQTPTRSPRSSLFVRDSALGERHLETATRLRSALAALAHGHARQLGDQGLDHAARLGVVRSYRGQWATVPPDGEAPSAQSPRALRFRPSRPRKAGQRLV